MAGEKILLVDDEEDILELLRFNLSKDGYRVVCASSGEQGLKLARSEMPDLIVLDLMLPGMDGLEVTRHLKNDPKTRAIPVTMLTAKGEESDIVTGLELGAHDYITKPFAFSELLARIQALIRRASGLAEPTRLTVGDLSMNLLSREVTRGGRKIELQPIEFSLLEYLMRSAGRVVSKTMIMEHVWNYNFDPQTNVVEARICRLRDKIDRAVEKKLIHTIRGVGYVLRPA